MLKGSRGGGGLIRRTVIAGGLLALLVSIAFAVVLLAIDDLRNTAVLARHSDELLVAANHLERLVIDLETGLRGFLITGDERFLAPWDDAQRAFPQQAQMFERLAAARDAGQGRRAQHIAVAGASYIEEYSVPTVEAARRAVAAPRPTPSGLPAPSARMIAVIDEGKRRTDDLRREFDGFATIEHDHATARQKRSGTAARRATSAATAGIAGSVLLVALFTDYLTRTIVRPVRRAATMAGQLAAGDLAVRLPETGAAEIGSLERAFNTMGRSLETSHNELRLLLEEQAALRRVATLVARAVSPPEVFEAVAREVARLLDAPATGLLRFEPAGTATIVALGGELARDLPLGNSFSVADDIVPRSVARAGHAVRIESYEDLPGLVPSVACRLGLRSGVAAPIVVEGQLWGVIGASWTRPGRLPVGIAAASSGICTTARNNASSPWPSTCAASRRRCLRSWSKPGCSCPGWSRA
jgi:CHASE3 domain sensor protein